MKNLKSAKALLSIGTIATLLAPATMYAATSYENANNDPSLSIQSTLPSDEFLRLFTTPISGNEVEGYVFDHAEFRAHPCFSAVGEEVDYCLNMFGVTTDFSAEVESATDGDDATTDDTDDMNDTDAHEQRVIDHNESAIDENEAAGHISTRARSEHLWELCMNNSDEEPSACFQNYLRFVTDSEISFSDMDDFFRVSDDN